MEDTATDQIDTQSYLCKACRLPINPAAKVCPHCYSHQYETRGHKVSIFLQWSAVGITVISLITALHTLSNFYAGWVEKNNTVAELGFAAHWLEKADNFYDAWSLVEQALKLKPGDQKIRQYQTDLAMHWVRSVSTRANRKITYAEMADTVTPVLYGALTSLDNKRASDVYAHIGFAQYLKNREADIFTNMDELFARSLKYDSNNIYAHVFLGFWQIVSGREKNFSQAMKHYEIALNNTDASVERQNWARQWYIYGLNWLNDTKDKKIKLEIVSRIFTTANQARKANFVVANKRAFDSIFFMFGSFSEVDEDIDKMINILPPDEYLATLEWLTKKYEIKKTSSTKFVVARLNELLGRNDIAMPLYKEIITNSPYKGTRLEKKVVDAYVRITQHPPEEVLARDYNNDAIPDSGDLWQFHADSLLKFNLIYTPDNFTAALEYFNPQADNPKLKNRASEAMQIFAQARDRIKDWIDEREVEVMRGYKSAFNNEASEEISKSNLYKLMVQYGELAYLNKDWATAATAFEDTLARFGDDNPTLLYALTRAYSQQAAIAETKQLKKQYKSDALKALRTMIDESIKSRSKIAWGKIKKDQALTALRTDNGYKQLVLGH